MGTERGERQRGGRRGDFHPRTPDGGQPGAFSRQTLVDVPDGVPRVLREALSRMTGPRASASPDSLSLKGRQQERGLRWLLLLLLRGGGEESERVERPD